MDNPTPIPTTNTTGLPPVTDNGSLKKYSALSLKEKWQLFYKRSEYVNSKSLSKVDAENTARADLGVESLTPEEAQKLTEPGLVTKVVDNKVFQTIGLTALIHDKLDWVQTRTTEQAEGARSVTTEKITMMQTATTDKIQDAKTATTEKIHDAKTATQTKVETLKNSALEKVHSLKEQTFAKAEEAKEKLLAKIPFLHKAETGLQSVPNEAVVGASVVAVKTETPTPNAIAPSIVSPVSTPEVVASAPSPIVSVPSVVEETKQEALIQ